MNIIESNLNFKPLDYGNKPDAIVLHHAEASSCTIQDIHRWHLNKGWAGCGYHYFVRKDGTIYTGRPESAKGVHCPGFNSHSIGICSEGAYTRETMPDAQKNAIIELSLSIKNKYGISNIKGHGEVYNTDCPGANYPLEEIRNSIINNTNKSTPKLQTWQININGDIIRRLQHEFNVQYKANIPEDGWCGDQTVAAWIPIKRGARGNITRIIQELLQRKGYGGYFSAYGLDGSFGPATDKAVRAFQRDYGLRVDGSVGPATFRALVRK